MSRILKMKVFFALLGIVFSVSCSHEPDGSFAVITLEPGLARQSSASPGITQDDPPESGIYSIGLSAKKGEPELLTSGFHSAKSPSISCDGRSMLFSGRKSESDKWAVWEMRLKSRKTRILTGPDADCSDPVYLPGERFAYIRHMTADSLKAEQAVFTGSLKRDEDARITFNPWSYRSLAVLKDGRLLATGRQSFPETGKEMIVVMRPDGSKAEMFYCPAEGHSAITRPAETSEGKIIFVEAAGGAATGSVTGISYSRPLHSAGVLAGDLSKDVSAVAVSVRGRILFALATPGSEESTLSEYLPSGEGAARKIFAAKDFTIKEIAFIESFQRPRKLPSEVDQGVKSGLLLCQNISLTGFQAPESTSAEPAAVKIEILGLDKSLGIVDAAADGSVYLKVMADMPFRVQTLDKNGRIVNGPGAWLYLRPNERRGCVGCHEDQESVPANRMAEAVKRQPVSVPVAITGISEKDIELE